jgi:hypothetical protein
MRHDVPQCGSCARCGRALDLAAAKVDGRWYGNAACADPTSLCPLDVRARRVAEEALISRPHRFFRRRAPKELRREG